eukprot:763312-Hanusia_phi.AAC.2
MPGSDSPVGGTPARAGRFLRLRLLNATRCGPVLVRSLVTVRYTWHADRRTPRARDPGGQYTAALPDPDRRDRTVSHESRLGESRPAYTRYAGWQPGLAPGRARPGGAAGSPGVPDTDDASRAPSYSLDMACVTGP